MTRIRAVVLIGSALVTGIVLVAPLGAGQDRVTPIADLLDAYHRGEFDVAVQAGASRPDLATWRKAFPAAARAWIDQRPQERARRRLVAAGLVLEVARERYERDADIWTEIDDAVEWACAELRREPAPTAGEQAWQRASVALGQRVYGAFGPAVQRGVLNHVDDARRRFPSDPRFPLARAVLAAWRSDRDLAAREGHDRGIPPLGSIDAGQSGFPTAGLIALDRGVVNVRAESAAAIKSFTPWLRDPEVGAEAELHVSHLFLTQREWASALEHSRLALELPGDNRARYLGFVMAGLALQPLGRGVEAREAYRAALEALPSGQSAALLLATLVDTFEPPAEIASLVGHGLAAPILQDDPWRLYYYGDYVRWTAYIAQLREALR
jgi:hypothetical protein